MSDRPIFCFKTHVLFCSCVKPNQEMVGRHVQQNKVSRFVLHCGVWNSGELLRFKISLNYIPRTSPVPPDLGLSVAAPFSYHNGASHENRGEASNLLRNFTVVLHIFVLQFSLCDVNWVSQRIHSFILTVSYSVLYISNTSIIMIFYNTLLQM